MEFRKAIKNIIALGTGLTMLGATVFGAMATDLGQYPNQYIKDGVFDGLMVVGTTASTSDVLGIVDIATSLQYQSKTDKVLSEGKNTQTTTLSGDAYEFGTNSNSLEINEYLGEVKSTVNGDDFKPLSESTMRTRKGRTDVKQYLKFANNEGLKVVYDEQDDVVEQYLECKDKDVMFTYELQFTDGLYSDIYENVNGNDKSNNNVGYLNDLNNENIYMLGHSYTITEGYVNDCSKNDVRLTLMTGSTEVVMQEYETKTVSIGDKEYEINIMIISDGNSNSDSSVKFMVNNEQTNKMYEGDTYTFKDDLTLGVKDILANEGSEQGGEDVVSFYLGANKIEFNNGNVEIEEERIEDANVIISCSTTDNEIRISSIKYTLKADADKSGDLIVREGDSVREELDEPQGMLGIDWDIKYLGMNAEDTYDVSVQTDGDDRYELSFLTQEDVEYTMPLVYIDTSKTYPQWGEDDEYKLVLDNTKTIDENDYFILTDNVNDEDGVTHILQLEEIDTDDNKAIFNDIGTGEEIEVEYGTGTTGTLMVGGDDYHVTDINATSLKVTELTNVIRLNGGHKLELQQGNPLGKRLEFTTPGSLTDDGKEQSFIVDLMKNGEVVDLDVTGISMVTDDNDYRRGVTGYGIKLEQDTNDEDELLITIPEGQVFPIVALTGESYSLDVNDNIVGGIVVPEYTPISVGKAVLDSEIANYANENVIAIGGPCVNTIAAAMLGVPSSMPGCYEQFPVKEGEGIIKMVENGDNVAMLVAGYTATDTRNAAKIIAQFGNHTTELTGKTEIIVIGNQIKTVVPITNETTEI